MPGKTKHFQTLFLPQDEEICLMDCPGLVFPSFTFSKADLVINGIMPIDKIVDYLVPVQIIIYNIPRHILEAKYGIKLPDLYSSSQFLQVVALKHGFLTGRSIASEAKVAKIILKDYVSGSLLYCYPRPDYNKDIHGDLFGYLFKDIDQKEIETITENAKLLKEIPPNFNDNFEKIGIEDLDKKTTLKNYKDLDEDFFKENDTPDLSNSKIPKEMRMQLKFAMKRGDITEEDYENAFTFEEAKELLNNIENNKKTSGKDKSLVQKKLIQNY